MTEPTTRYEDELAIVEYLVSRLERVLSGRHAGRVINSVPIDICRLGVLLPQVSTLGPESHDAETTQHTESDGTGAQGQEDVPEVSTQTPGQVDAPGNEPSQSPRRDRTRRPSTSALGFELLVTPPEDGLVELQVVAEFAIYTRHLPSYGELRAFFGGGPSDTESSHSDTIAPLAECIERHEIAVGPTTVRLRLPSDQKAVMREPIQSEIDAILSAAYSRHDAWLKFDRKPDVPVGAMTSEDAYHKWIESLALRHERVGAPPLCAELDIRARPWGEASYRIGCYLRNTTPRQPDNSESDQYHIFGDARLGCTVASGTLKPIEILPIPDDYQFDRRVWVVGHNTSAYLDQETREVVTRSLARYYQPRRRTRDTPSARFEDLTRAPVETLENIRRAMVLFTKEWDSILNDNALELSTKELRRAREDFTAFKEEEVAFAAGIAALRADSRLLDAFVAMNRTIQRVAQGKYQSWRLFQIVFIVMQLPVLVAREGILEGKWPGDKVHDWSDFQDWADVLWFPTGGGKTEAYMGLISCAMLYDRLRGKRLGITAWIRFPLRMLSVQQLERAMKWVWETEEERKVVLGPDADQSDPISLGYLVGSSSTPNSLDAKVFRDLEGRKEKLLLIPVCPCCGGNDVEIVLDPQECRIRHVCPTCGELPVYISDSEVYRYLPTLVLGTVDKIATIAFQPRFPILWGAADWSCPQHGYGFGRYCTIYGCKSSRESRIPVDPYDAAPSFQVQDELHLLQEELGAFAGHYETLLAHCQRHVAGQAAKIIAATATIEGFEHQVRHIYGVQRVRRFPERSYDRYSTFYVQPDKLSETGGQKTERIYVGFRPVGGRGEDAAALCADVLLEESRRLIEEPDEVDLPITGRSKKDINALLYYYSVVLTYVTSLRSGTRVRDVLERSHGGLNRAGRTLNVELHSSRSSMRDLADVIDRLENPPSFSHPRYIDGMVATSIISHGVDVDRLNLMIMDRVPDEIAEYIQASSRCGRSHVGLVVGILPSYSLRASSIYHRFFEFHDHLERMVSPVPVNRFAKYSVQRTLPGMVAGLLLGRFNAEDPDLNLNQRHQAAAFLQSEDEQFRLALREAYALQEDTYAAELVDAFSERLNGQLELLIQNIVASNERRLSDALRPKPMTSLRDVDEGVPFVPSTESAGLAEVIARARTVRDNTGP